MIKIVISLPVWDKKAFADRWTKKQYDKIEDWFLDNNFDIPFLPKRNMTIDLDSFFRCKRNEILDEVDIEIGYGTVKEIIICSNHIKVLIRL